MTEPSATLPSGDRPPMQFHLNGFRPGDPHRCEPLKRPEPADPETEVDVLDRRLRSGRV